jgi:hypothetical protein
MSERKAQVFDVDYHVLSVIASISTPQVLYLLDKGRQTDFMQRLVYQSNQIPTRAMQDVVLLACYPVVGCHASGGRLALSSTHSLSSRSPCKNTGRTPGVFDSDSFLALLRRLTRLRAK